MIIIYDMETGFLYIATFKKVLALNESGRMQVRILGTTYKDFTSNLFFLLYVELSTGVSLRIDTHTLLHF